MAEFKTEIRKPFEGSQINVTLTITREFRVRLWLGKFFMALGARVLVGRKYGGKHEMHIETKHTKPTHPCMPKTSIDIHVETETRSHGPPWRVPAVPTPISFPGSDAMRQIIAENYPSRSGFVVTDQKLPEGVPLATPCSFPGCGAVDDRWCRHWPRYEFVDAETGLPFDINKFLSKPSPQHKAECDCAEFHGGACQWPKCAGAKGGFVPAGKPHIVGEKPSEQVAPKDFDSELGVSKIDALPIPMLIYCPKCSLQHIDEPKDEWTNPPHRSHLCAFCGYIWRHADVSTVGVVELCTRGGGDLEPSPMKAKK